MAQRKKTPIGIASYPNLFEPKPKFQGEGDLVYSVNLVCDPNAPELHQMRADVQAAMQKQWPNGAPATIRDPFKDDPEFPGKVVITLRCGKDYPPLVVGPDTKPLTKQSGAIYAGCLIQCTYDVYPYTKGSGGVNIGLGDVQKVGDGPALVSSRRSEDDFAPVAPINLNDPNAALPSAPQPQQQQAYQQPQQPQPTYDPVTGQWVYPQAAPAYQAPPSQPTYQPAPAQYQPAPTYQAPPQQPTYQTPPQQPAQPVYNPNTGQWEYPQVDQFRV